MKDRLVPHLIVEVGLEATAFYEKASGAENEPAMMAQDGKRVMAAQDTFWGARHGRVRDPSGHIWAFHALHKKKDSAKHESDAPE